MEKEKPKLIQAEIALILVAEEPQENTPTIAEEKE